MSVREYLVGVTGAAMLCGLVRVMLPGKGTVASVIKVLTGVLMLLSVARPFVSTSFDNIRDWTEDLSFDAQAIVSDAENAANQEIRERIKENCEAYILSKASEYGVSIEVTVDLTDAVPPTPASVTISGAVSPYAKQAVSRMLVQEFGIVEEEQKWIG
ncbi:MAG: hypothetical protein E7470_05680 [Ruminococcaceae bacterium]|nr:hypothetical protein [Oscillospiraceae bacterium]